MSKSRYKVGDCVVYADTSGYWKVFKILEVGDGQCRYKCLDMIGSKHSPLVGNVSYFTYGSPVGIDGVVVDESNYMSYIIAKVL